MTTTADAPASSIPITAVPAVAIVLGRSTESQFFDEVAGLGEGWRQGLQAWKQALPQREFVVMCELPAPQVQGRRLFVVCVNEGSLTNAINQTLLQLNGLQCGWLFLVEESTKGQLTNYILARAEVAGHA